MDNIFFCIVNYVYKWSYLCIVFKWVLGEMLVKLIRFLKLFFYNYVNKLILVKI